MPAIKLTRAELEWYAADLERQNRELRAQVDAGQWTPLTGIGVHSEGDYVLSLLRGGKLLITYHRGHRDIRNVGMELPDDLRLCRRTPAAPDPLAALVPPLAEWPDDAVAWCVDIDSYWMWTGWWPTGHLVTFYDKRGEQHHPRKSTLPPGFDFRTSLRLRPGGEVTPVP